MGTLSLAGGWLAICIWKTGFKNAIVAKLAPTKRGTAPGALMMQGTLPSFTNLLTSPTPVVPVFPIRSGKSWKAISTGTANVNGTAPRLVFCTGITHRPVPEMVFDDDELMGQLIRLFLHMKWTLHSVFVTTSAPVLPCRWKTCVIKAWVEAKWPYAFYYGLCPLQLCAAGR